VAFRSRDREKRKQARENQKRKWKEAVANGTATQSSEHLYCGPDCFVMCSLRLVRLFQRKGRRKSTRSSGWTIPQPALCASPSTWTLTSITLIRFESTVPLLQALRFRIRVLVVVFISRGLTQDVNMAVKQLGHTYGANRRAPHPVQVRNASSFSLRPHCLTDRHADWMQLHITSVTGRCAKRLDQLSDVKGWNVRTPLVDHPRNTLHLALDDICLGRLWHERR
jgi:hypothetical protein